MMLPLERTAEHPVKTCLKRFIILLKLKRFYFIDFFHEIGNAVNESVCSLDILLGKTIDQIFSFLERRIISNDEVEIYSFFVSIDNDVFNQMWSSINEDSITFFNQLDTLFKFSLRRAPYESINTASVMNSLALTIFWLRKSSILLLSHSLASSSESSGTAANKVRRY